MEYLGLFAYLDPGSGSVLLQALLGGTAALAVTWKLWWGRLLTFLRIRRREPEPVAEGERAAEEPGSRSRVS